MTMVARAPLRLGLPLNIPWWKLSPCWTSLRCVSATTRQGSIKGRPRNSVRRFIPEDSKKFVRPDGRLLTTRENRDFFLEHGLEPDNGVMTKVYSGPEFQRTCAEFNTTIAYSPRYIIHPYDLRFFEPRRHPLAPMKRAQYLRKLQDESLWIMMTGTGSSSVVRTLTQRRMKAALYRALEKLGYQSGGTGREKEIRGTVWVIVHDPTKASGLPAERFGRVTAQALDKECSRRFGGWAAISNAPHPASTT